MKTFNSRKESETDIIIKYNLHLCLVNDKKFQEAFLIVSLIEPISKPFLVIRNFHFNQVGQHTEQTTHSKHSISPWETLSIVATHQRCHLIVQRGFKVNFVVLNMFSH